MLPMIGRAMQVMHTYSISISYDTGKGKLSTVPEKWVEEILSVETIKSHSIPKPEHVSIQPLQSCNFKPFTRREALQTQNSLNL